MQMIVKDFSRMMIIKYLCHLYNQQTQRFRPQQNMKPRI